MVPWTQTSRAGKQKLDCPECHVCVATPPHSCNLIHVTTHLFCPKYQHVWDGICKKARQIDDGDDKLVLQREVELEHNDNWEQNIQTCYEICREMIGCQSFIAPREFSVSNRGPNDAEQAVRKFNRCYLYRKPCTTLYGDGARWQTGVSVLSDHRTRGDLTDSVSVSSYQMGCFGDQTCKLDWLDPNYLSHCLRSLKLGIVTNLRL